MPRERKAPFLKVGDSIEINNGIYGSGYPSIYKGNHKGTVIKIQRSKLGKIMYIIVSLPNSSFCTPIHKYDWTFIPEEFLTECR